MQTKVYLHMAYQSLVPIYKFFPQHSMHSIWKEQNIKYISNLFCNNFIVIVVVDITITVRIRSTSPQICEKQGAALLNPGASEGAAP